MWLTPRRCHWSPSADGGPFEQAGAELVALGYGAERARHIVAIRMRMPAGDIERLREAAR